MSAHSKTPYITPSMDVSSGKGVVRGRKEKPLEFAGICLAPIPRRMYATDAADLARLHPLRIHARTHACRHRNPPATGFWQANNNGHVSDAEPEIGIVMGFFA